MIPTRGVPDITPLLTRVLAPVFAAVYTADSPAPLDGKPADWCTLDLQAQQQETPVTRYARLTLTASCEHPDGTADMTALAGLMRRAEEAVLTLPRLGPQVVTCDVQAGPVSLVSDGHRVMELTFLLTLPTNLNL